MTAHDNITKMLRVRSCGSWRLPRYRGLPVYKISKTETDEETPPHRHMFLDVSKFFKKMTPDTEPHHIWSPDFNEPSV